MDELFEKMQSVLSDPESMGQLQQLAEMLGSTSEGEGSEDTKEESSSDDGGFPFDIGTIMQLSSLMSNTGQDNDTALLLALKPHLKEERQKKVDKALKFMKVLTIWKTLKDSGLLKDFM